MTRSGRLAALSLLPMFVVFVQCAYSQNIRTESVSLTPEDRAMYKFLPLQGGGRLLLQGGFEARPGMSLIFKPNEKKPAFNLSVYISATNDSKSTVWLQAQLHTPGSSQTEDALTEIKPDAYGWHGFKIEELTCAADYPLHITVYSDHDRKQAIAALDTVLHFDENCQQKVETAKTAIIEGAHHGVMAFAYFSGWTDSPSAEERDRRHLDAERLEFKPPEGWKIVNHSETEALTVIQLVKQGETIDNWSESLTIKNLTKASTPFKSAGEMLEGVKQDREKQCPNSIKWNDIEKRENSVIYEWSSKPCPAWPEQSEISRIIFGPKTVFVLQYAKKVKELAPDDRDAWIKRLAEAELKGTN